MRRAYVWEISGDTCCVRIQGTMQDVSLQLNDQQGRRKRLVIGDWVEFPEHSGKFEIVTGFRLCPEAVVSGEYQVFDLEMIQPYMLANPKRKEDVVVAFLKSADGDPTAVILRPSTKQLFRARRRDGDALVLSSHELVAHVSFCSKLPPKDMAAALSAPR